MATGRKTGGRTKGTPNNRTQDVIDKLEELGCDPIAAMARLAMKAESDGDVALASRLYTELSPYTAPKRKAVEQTIRNEEERSHEAVEAEYREAMRQIINQYEAMPEAERQALMGREAKH